MVISCCPAVTELGLELDPRWLSRRVGCVAVLLPGAAGLPHHPNAWLLLRLTNGSSLHSSINPGARNVQLDAVTYPVWHIPLDGRPSPFEPHAALPLPRRSIHRHASTPGDPSLQQLLEALPALPRDAAPQGSPSAGSAGAGSGSGQGQGVVYGQLQATVCSTIARYARWLERSMQVGGRGVDVVR